MVNCDNISEFTIESNPETINNDLISFFQQIPKIRLSIGIQRLDNGELGILGRLGNMSHIDKVLDMVLPEIKNVSADIIIGVPNCLDLSEKLDTFLSTYKLQHLSAYFLTVEDGTVLQSRIENGSFPSPDDIGPEEMFNIRDVLTGHDFEHYEISNYAKETFRCKHNMHYWKQGDYIGLGPSAVGTVMGGKRLAQQSDLRSWLSVDNASIENLTATDLRNEFVMLGLRLVEDGLNIEILESKFGKQSDKFYISLKESVNNGFLQWNNSIVKLTDNGMSFSNSVMGQLFEE